MTNKFLKLSAPSTLSMLLKVMVTVWAILLLSATGLHAQETKKKLTVGIVPQQSASKLARSWLPILRYISDQSGIQLIFRTAPTIPEFEKRVAEGQYDIAYMNPLHYVIFSKAAGYQAFAKQSEKRIIGLLVARKDFPENDLEGLRQQKLAFPSPAAFAASVLPRANLKALGIDFKPTYVTSHDSVYRNVAAGHFIAGGGIQRTLNSLDPSVRSNLKVIWQSEGYTPHAFAHHPRLESETKDLILDAMLRMHLDNAGKALLAKIKFKAIEAATDEDWNDVRALNISAENASMYIGE